MTLHFGGSIPGIKTHLKDYHEIRSTILKMEHTLARDWLVGQKHEGIVNIFSENEKSISRSDGVILDATFDTHGVGIQLAIALMYKRPILLLIKKNAGNPITKPKLINAQDKKLLQTAEYENIAEVENIIAGFVAWIESNGQLARFNLELDRKLDNYLRLKSKLNHTSKAEEIRRLVEDDLNQHDKDSK